MTSSFIFSGPHISSAHVGAMESRLGVHLPDEYRQFLLEHNGGRPVPDDSFMVPDRVGNDTDSIGGFYQVTPTESPESIESAARDLRGRIPADSIPLAYCACGDTLLIGCGASNYGKILLWDRDAEGGGEPTTYAVAESLGAFMDSLFSTDDLDA